ncbi:MULTISPECIES: hypothetical protein [Shimia]|uniref:hypothetical protein n=1 Tax=Shimia TaxID=573139 RepID=UPI001FB33F56|nr:MULTISPECIES: hypothetical protein [Shimia]MDV4143945.1 hypothetical protein [Shimia sp. FJ5]
MMFQKTVPALLVGLSLVAGCVSPEVVASTDVSDESMTCEEIRTQRAQLDEIREEARKGKTASGKNVAAVLLFWPAAIGNYANASEAIEAANARQKVLVDLAKKKRCKL